MKNFFISVGVVILALALFGEPVASAETITLTNGQVLKDATVTAEDPVWVTIAHSDGIVRIEKALLPPELQKLHPIDREKAASFASQYNAERAKLIEQQKEAELNTELDKASIPLSVNSEQVIEGGVLGHLYDRAKHSDLGFCFVSGLLGVHDSEHWEGKGWKVGLYSFENVSNFMRTVPRYTVDRHEAMLAFGLIKEVPAAERETIANVVRQWQKLAIRRSPELEEHDSELSRKFSALYAQKQAYPGNPKFFEYPDWPLLLATEAATGVNPVANLRSAEEQFSLNWWALSTKKSQPVTIEDFLETHEKYFDDTEGSKNIPVILTGTLGKRDNVASRITLREGSHEVRMSFKGLLVSVKQKAELKHILELPDDFSKEITIQAKVDRFTDSEELFLNIKAVRLW